MKTLKKIAQTLVLVFAFTAANAQFDVISASDAVKLVGDPNTVFVATVSAQDFARVHIQNAVNIEYRTLVRPGAIEGLLKSPADLAKILGDKGVDPAKTIIIYDNGRYVYSTYLYWVLDYLGYNNVKVLDGHMTGWRAARGPVGRNVVNPSAVTVTPRLRSGVFADYNYVKSKVNNSGTTILDVSAPNEHRAGNIPGSINIESKQFFTESNSQLKSRAALEKILADNKVAKDKEIILYCTSSARAGTVYLALKGLGYRNIKIYEGGWNEYKTK
jgi:thiosulfate/3-mercaptopyruvate sulfurtransferase